MAERQPGPSIQSFNPSQGNCSLCTALPEVTAPRPSPACRGQGLGLGTDTCADLALAYRIATTLLSRVMLQPARHPRIRLDLSAGHLSGPLAEFSHECNRSAPNRLLPSYHRRTSEGKTPVSRRACVRVYRRMSRVTTAI